MLFDQYDKFMSEAPNMHCDLVFTTVTEWVQIMGSHPLPLASGAGACDAGTHYQVVARTARRAKRITHAR